MVEEPSKLWESSWHADPRASPVLSLALLRNVPHNLLCWILQLVSNNSELYLSFIAIPGRLERLSHYILYYRLTPFQIQISSFEYANKAVYSLWELYERLYEVEGFIRADYTVTQWIAHVE